MSTRKRCIPFVLACALALPPAAAGAAPDWAVAVFPSGREFSLEIAADPESRRLGYMYREHVGPGDGMLFLFESTDHHGIWMKNCKVALDIVWLDAQWRVVEIVHDLPPCPAEGDCVPVRPMRVARYVLEVAAGVAAEAGLSVGDHVEILSEPELP
jgi:uncharacterized membrane protein (UPF0127 family)